MQEIYWEDTYTNSNLLPPLNSQTAVAIEGVSLGIRNWSSECYLSGNLELLRATLYHKEGTGVTH